MKYSGSFVTVQDVPDEIALGIFLSGCPHKCKNCHSSFTWDPNYGKILNKEVLRNLISRQKYISCVLFYGGDWDLKFLNEMLDVVDEFKLKKCLYTGLEMENFPCDFIERLDYIKTGKYIQEKGPLFSENSNQKFIILKN